MADAPWDVHQTTRKMKLTVNASHAQLRDVGEVYIQFNSIPVYNSKKIIFLLQFKTLRTEMIFSFIWSLISGFIASNLEYNVSRSVAECLIIHKLKL